MSHLTLWIWTSTVRLTYPLEEVSKSKQNTKKPRSPTIRGKRNAARGHSENLLSRCNPRTRKSKSAGRQMQPFGGREPHALQPRALNGPERTQSVTTTHCDVHQRGDDAVTWRGRTARKRPRLKLLRMDCLVRQLCGRNALCSWLSCYTTKYDQTPHIP